MNCIDRPRTTVQFANLDDTKGCFVGCSLIKSRTDRRFSALHASFCQRVEKALAENHIVRPDINQEAVLEWLLGSWAQGQPVFVMQTVSALSGGSHPLISRSPIAIYRLVHSLAAEGWLQLDEFPDEKRRKKLLPTLRTERYFALLADCLSEVVQADVLGIANDQGTSALNKLRMLGKEGLETVQASLTPKTTGLIGLALESASIPSENSARRS
jgi:hypothetical protein